MAESKFLTTELKPGYVYVLALIKGKFYVGYTERKDYARIEEQLRGVGALWVKMYPMTQLVAIFPGTKDDEHDVTVELMKTLGWQNVRGGKYCNPYMSTMPTELRSKETDTIISTLSIFYATKPGKGPQSELEVIKSSIPPYHDRCTRCFRWGHSMTYCLSRAFSRGRCYRCNAERCKSDTCVATVFCDD